MTGRSVPVAENGVWTYIVGDTVHGHATHLQWFGRAIVVCADVGVSMDKPKEFRRVVPHTCMRLRTLWEHGMRCRDGSMPLSLEVCTVCGIGINSLKCTCCGMSWHSACGARLKSQAILMKDNCDDTEFAGLVDAIQKTVHFPPDLLPEESLPQSLCALCVAFLAI